jgi:hypothetical protein
MAQGGAYATGVLVLITSASIWLLPGAAWARNKWHSLAYAMTALGVSYTPPGVNVIGHPDGPKIAGFFILLVLVTSLISRIMRVLELRVKSIQFDETAHQFLLACQRVKSYKGVSALCRSQVWWHGLHCAWQPDQRNALCRRERPVDFS